MNAAFDFPKTLGVRISSFCLVRRGTVKKNNRTLHLFYYDTKSWKLQDEVLQVFIRANFHVLVNLFFMRRPCEVAAQRYHFCTVFVILPAKFIIQEEGTCCQILARLIQNQRRLIANGWHGLLVFHLVCFFSTNFFN